MQLNPSAVLVPCVFPAIGQAGRGGLQGSGEMRRAGGQRGREVRGVQVPDRHDRSAEVRRICRSKHYHLALDSSCGLTALTNCIHAEGISVPARSPCPASLDLLGIKP